MTARANLLLAGSALLVPLLLLPALQRPLLILVLAAGLAALAAALDSAAWPVGLAGVGVLLIGALGSNPFPDKTLAVLTFGWIAAAVALAIARRPAEVKLDLLVAPPVLLTVLLALWQLARLGSSLSPAYGEYKFQLFVAQNLALVVAGVLIGRRARDLRIYVVLALLMAAASGVLLSLGLNSGQAQAVVGGRFSASSGQSPIELGRQAALGLLVGAFILLSYRSIVLRLLALATMPLIAVAFFASGSRGPVLGLASGLLVLLLLTLRDPSSRLRLALVIGGGALAGVFVSRLVPADVADRSLSVLTGREGGLSSNGRFELWGDAWRLFLEHPIAGIGPGGFAAVNPVEVYPHNLFFEVASELGLVGLVLLFATVGYAVAALVVAWRSGERSIRPSVALVGALLASATFNSLVSSNLPTNNGLWLAVGLATGLLRGGGLGASGRAEVLQMRGRRIRRLQPAATRTLPARGHPPEAAPPSDPGAVLEPADGALLHGRVLVRARPATTAWRHLRLGVEIQGAGGSWIEAPAPEAFDLLVGREGRREHFGIFRSRELAQLAAEALGLLGDDVAIEPARKLPWRAPAEHTVFWDSTRTPDGSYALRVYTLDAAGLRTPSDAIRVDVDNAAAQSAAGHARGAIAERRMVLQAEEAELAAAVEAVAARERELEARTTDLARIEVELDRIAAREQELVLRSKELVRIEAELDGISARERELSVQAEGLGRVETEIGRLAEQEHELTTRTGELIRVEAEILLREQAVEERMRLLQARSLEVDALEAEAAPAAAPLGLAAGWTLGEHDSLPPLQWLRAAMDAQLEQQQPEQAENWVYYLALLGEYADADGYLPDSFRGVVLDVFGDLLD